MPAHAVTPKSRAAFADVNPSTRRLVLVGLTCALDGSEGALFALSTGAAAHRAVVDRAAKRTGEPPEGVRGLAGLPCHTPGVRAGLCLDVACACMKARANDCVAHRDTPRMAPSVWETA